MSIIEAQVHQKLLQLSRTNEGDFWQHHLTLARLVARGLRLRRSALIQTRTGVGDSALSYLTPILLSDKPVVLVTPPSLQTWLVATEIPRLQTQLATHRSVQIITNLRQKPDGIALITPDFWLGSMLGDRPVATVTTLLNPVDDLWQWVQDHMRCRLQLRDWETLQQQNPAQQHLIQTQYNYLKTNLLRRSPNPYHCHLLSPDEQTHLIKCLQLPKLPEPWRQFQQTLRHEAAKPLCWAMLNRQDRSFSINVAPQKVSTLLKPLWEKQATLFIGGFLDTEKIAPTFRDQIGLDDDLTCVKFTPPRQQQQTQVYLPEKRLPLPNTPEFQGELLTQLQRLVRLSRNVKRPIVLLINDVPLQAQMGSALAAEFGSTVKVEQTNLQADSILICGWDFWRSLTNPLFYGQSLDFPLPQLMAIATLPLPSLENPLVAGRVAHYKAQRQDWFRLYLLPTALRELQRAIYPLHQDQSLIAILDNRINHRAYGQQILDAIQPCSYCSYLDPSWFGYW
ncbi:helicase C-terminal domain-containing protein [[Limnothrix rosea] IAM M-220]|uniref:helicase C-terminal domain-containing protein n=1 Tax=[Limnothrix rosea] IAM M-220 TaxID=454133 RepID=UPI0009619807|nr:helicase C-terminal domain-containing protein [[Limnothrix rosea] IAM M-220]OKH18504.1 DNA helicase [[Limnothrix rosea] IAM M-220]